MAEMKAMMELLVGGHNPRLTAGEQTEALRLRAQADRQRAAAEPLAVEIEMPEETENVPRTSEEVAATGALATPEAGRGGGESVDAETAEDPETRNPRNRRPSGSRPAGERAAQGAARPVPEGSVFARLGKRAQPPPAKPVHARLGRRAGDSRSQAVTRVPEGSEDTATSLRSGATLD